MHENILINIYLGYHIRVKSMTFLKLTKWYKISGSTEQKVNKNRTLNKGHCVFWFHIQFRVCFWLFLYKHLVFNFDFWVPSFQLSLPVVHHSQWCFKQMFMFTSWCISGLWCASIPLPPCLITSTKNDLRKVWSSIAFLESS